MIKRAWEAVVMGGSAGSLEALSAILPVLPATFPLPILVVVHLPPDKKSVLAELLQSKSALRVREAEDKEKIEASRVYFAPPDYHLLVGTNGEIVLSYDEPQLFSRPSIDVLFESAVDVYGAGLIGIILSGANDDGASGLKMIEAAGGMTIVQSPETAYSATMPAAALKKCPSAESLSAEEIGLFLKRNDLNE